MIDGTSEKDAMKKAWQKLFWKAWKKFINNLASNLTRTVQ